jgi:5-methylcytosine-specific restriction endonuclease McrA
MFSITCKRCKTQTQRKTATAKYCLSCSKAVAKKVANKYNDLAKTKRHNSRTTRVRVIEKLADEIAGIDTEARSFINECLAVNLPVLIDLEIETIKTYFAEELKNYNPEDPLMVGLCRLCKFQNGLRVCDDKHGFRVENKIKYRTNEKQKITARSHSQRYMAAIRADTDLPKWTAAEIRKRDKGICQICLLPIPTNVKQHDQLALNIDHIIPISSGGSNDFSNVQATHKRCNAWKLATVDYKHNKQRQEYMEKLVKAHIF